MGKKIVLLFLFLALFPCLSPAAEQAAGADEAAQDGRSIQSSSGLPIPRFVSLSSEKVFVRTGPGLRYPIKWVYQREGMPVEITQEFDTWRKIRDVDGDGGWVHQSMLSGDRTGIVRGAENVFVRKKPEADSGPTTYLEPNVVVGLDACAGTWCKVTADGYSGWMERKSLWGIYDSEDFD